MRFSARDRLPPSIWITSVSDARALGEKLLESRTIYGFDTETDGLGYDIVDGKGKEKQAGDGLGAYLEVICLAFDGQRYGVDVGVRHRDNLWAIAPYIHATQRLQAGYNWIFDANVWDWNTEGKYPLTRCYADALILWLLWDEDAEDTYGQRNLKAKARYYLGLNMTSFDDLILKEGGIRYCLDTPRLAGRTRNYCTRDAWAHLGMVALGQQLAEKLFWCMQCPECGQPMYTANEDKTEWDCYHHGWRSDGTPLSMWDWHAGKLQWDVKFLNVLKNMEQEGIPFNRDYTENFRGSLERSRLQALRVFQQQASDALVRVGGSPRLINPASPKQLADFYFRRRNTAGEVIGLGYPIRPEDKTKTGSPGTGKDAIDKLFVEHNAAAAEALLKYRALDKMLNTYVVGLPARTWAHTGRIHPRIRPEAATGRCTTSNPSSQNIMRDALNYVEPPAQIPPALTFEDLVRMWGCTEEEAISELGKLEYLDTLHSLHPRAPIQAPPGFKIVGADYEQLEVRLTAVESGDKRLIDVINSGKDMHSYTASIVYAAQVPGLTYEIVAEAKKWKDVGDNLADVAGKFRWNALSKMVANPATYTSEMMLRTGALPRPESQNVIREVAEKLEGLTSTLGAEGLALLLSLPSIEPAPVQEPPLPDTYLAALMTLVPLAPEEIWRAIFESMGLRDKEFRDYRQGAKNAIFGIIYGIGALGLAVQITKATGKRCTVGEAKPLIESIKHKAYPGIGTMVDRLQNTVVAYGYVRTRMGRYRHPKHVRSGNTGEVARAKRQASNSPIQGLAANIMEVVMIAISEDARWNEIGARLIMQIHDELVALVPEEHADEALTILLHHMEHSHCLRTPVPLLAAGGKADIWSDLK